MNLHKVLATNNWSYTNGYNMSKILGIMVHSTGCNNPNLRRYVGPDDGLLGPTSTGNWNQLYIYGQLNKISVHAFIGKLLDGTVATYQVQEWNRKCNHCGVGTSGKSGNTNYISFEICEDDLKSKEYFEAVYKEAVELCAYLCELYNLNPLTQIVCHSEGYKKGFASNHADVMHWFPKYGKSMDTFRVDVYNEMEDNNMTDEKFAEMMERYMANKSKEEVPNWAKEEFAKAKEMGITDGSAPMRPATRLETALMTKRAAEAVQK